MNKEQLIQYFNLYNQWEKNNNIKFTTEQINLIQRVQNEAQVNIELSNLISNTLISSEQERMNALNKYLKDQENKKEIKEEEIISKTYGIDISNIQHKYLDNGKEIFYFYDIKLGRNIVLENQKNGISLVEQLKEMQIENEKFQTGTDIQNTNQMLKEKQNKENIEIKMIPLNEINNHMNEIQTKNATDLHKIDYLIKNAERIGLSYINIENIIGIDKYGKIIEVTYDKENNRYMINEPISAEYKEENINTSEKINNNYTTEENYNNIHNDYEYKPEIKEQTDYEELTENIKQQIKQYYESPELLEILPEEEKKIWINYIELYKKHLQKDEQYLKQNKPKQKIYKKEVNKSGFADILILSLITGFLGGVLTTLTTLLLTK